jgi:geranylgeranyl pyrophosphate synthase
MDWLDSSPNQPLEKTILDWLTDSWFSKEPNSSFREGLISTIMALWPNLNSEPGRGRKPSFLPLPSLCCRALGALTPKIYAVNAAWALFYIASYLLDKVEDQETDHSLFTRYGIGGTANLTTGLILHAERMLIEIEPDENVNDEIIDILRIAFNRRLLDVCSGQHLDLTIKEPSLKDAWDIIDGKSGKFFSLGAYVGALFATTDAQQIENFSQFGRRLGILLQITNAINGLGREQQIGSDLVSGKRTLPVIYALEVLPAGEKGRLLDLLAKASANPSAEIEARKIIISAGAVVYLALEADRHRAQARTALSSAALNSEYTSQLNRLLDHAISTKEYYRIYGSKQE